MNKRKTISHTGNRTRIGRVRACYPNQLDYMGPSLLFCELPMRLNMEREQEDSYAY